MRVPRHRPNQICSMAVSLSLTIFSNTHFVAKHYSSVVRNQTKIWIFFTQTSTLIDCHVSSNNRTPRPLRHPPGCYQHYSPLLPKGIATAFSPEGRLPDLHQQQQLACNIRNIMALRMLSALGTAVLLGFSPVRKTFATHEQGDISPTDHLVTKLRGDVISSTAVKENVVVVVFAENDGRFSCQIQNHSLTERCIIHHHTHPSPTGRTYC